MRLHAGRQVCALQPFEHLLSRKIVAHSVVERQHNKGESKLGVGKHTHRVGHPAQRHFHRDGDLLLHLLGRMTGKEGDDLDLDV